MLSTQRTLGPVLLLSATLVGCASVPSDWGRADVAVLAAKNGRFLPEVEDAKKYTAEALAAPLTAERAVQLALINNPAVRAATAELGFAAAEVYDAGRLANPVFSATRLSPNGGNGPEPQLSLGIAYNFANLLFLAANKRFAEAQFEAAKLSVASAALDLATEVEAGWFEVLASEQLEQMRALAAGAQAASAELAQRYFDAGNINRRELALEKAAASEAQLALLAARAQAFAARSALNRLMGLTAKQNQWTLVTGLPEPLAQEHSLEALLKLGIDNRLDVLSLRRRAQAIADRYGLVRHTRLINEIRIGAERERDFDGTVNSGPTIELALPLFNWGGGRSAAIRAEMQQAEAALDEKVLDVSNEVHLQSSRVLAHKARANEYRKRLIPSREEAVARAQEEQNFMLISIFEVIQAKQGEYEAYAGYIESVRDYWTARTELARALGRTLPNSDTAAKTTLEPTEMLQPKRAGMDHSTHGGR